MAEQQSPEERFWRKVDRSGDCWIWTGRIAPNGYGHFAVKDIRTTTAHRWAYEYTLGTIPAGHVLDHLCRTKACVRPDHLDPVPQRENLRRGQHNMNKTHCPRGHPYDEQNTRHAAGRRHCRACVIARRICAL